MFRRLTNFNSLTEAETSAYYCLCVVSCQVELTRPSRLSTIAISCKPLSPVCIYSFKQPLTYSSFSSCSYNYRPTSARKFSLPRTVTSDSFLPPIYSIHLPDLQFTPRSNPVNLLTPIHSSSSSSSFLPSSSFPTLPTPLPLSGKSCDFSEAGPYKPAVHGGLSVYAAP